MNNNNSEVNGMVVALALIGVASIYLAVVFLAILAIYSVLMTFVCFWAWSEPRKFFKWTINPWEARSFVYSGLVGIVVTCVLVGIAANYLKFRIEDQYIWLIMAAGYGIGSNISAYITNKMQEEETSAHTARDITPSLPPVRSSANDNGDDGQSSFEFATWDDEEKR
jgi:hypothetical protein